MLVVFLVLGLIRRDCVGYFLQIRFRFLRFVSLPARGRCAYEDDFGKVFAFPVNCRAPFSTFRERFRAIRYLDLCVACRSFCGRLLTNLGHLHFLEDYKEGSFYLDIRFSRVGDLLRAGAIEEDTSRGIGVSQFCRVTRVRVVRPRFARECESFNGHASVNEGHGLKGTFRLLRQRSRATNRISRVCLCD